MNASGIRTALAVAVPLFMGQATGHDDLGLLVGLGGLNVSTADKFGAGPIALLATSSLVALAGLCGSSAESPAWLAACAMLVWAFTAGMAGALGDLAGNAAFASTVVFSIALGMPRLTHGIGGMSRFSCIGAGGLWATVLSMLFWKITGSRSLAPPPGPAAMRRESVCALLRANMTLKSSVFRYALRISLATLVAVILFKGFHIEHGYWLVLTVIVIVKPDFTATRVRAGKRMVGSIIGGLIAILVVSFVHSKIALDVLLVLFCVIAYSHSQSDYRLFVTFLTPFVVLMINVAAPGNWQVGLVRIVNSIIGGALALGVAYVLRPNEEPQTVAGVVETQ